MKSAVLNVSIDTETPAGERLRDMILSNEFKDGLLVVSWIDRQKYNIESNGHYNIDIYRLHAVIRSVEE